MGKEQLVGLSREKIAQAKQEREWSSNWALSVISTNVAELRGINQELDGKTTEEAIDFAGPRLKFLAEGFGKVPFPSLGPLEVITIWSVLEEAEIKNGVLQNYIALLLVLTPVVCELSKSDPQFKDFLEYFLENNCWLPAVAPNKEALLAIEEEIGRFGREVIGSVEQFIFKEVDLERLINETLQRQNEHSDNPEACEQAIADFYRVYEKFEQDPLLWTIRHNCSERFGILRFLGRIWEITATS